MMDLLPKTLMGAGAILLGLGFLLWALPPLGQLPGDILLKGEHSSLYFPIVTCLLLSVLVSLGLYLWNSFK